MATQHTFKLTGMVCEFGPGEFFKKATPATPQTADQVKYFVANAGTKNEITVCLQEDGMVRLSTERNPEGYILQKHATINMWKGECSGKKVHVMLKKITGQIIGWW
jgi:hypothetical protein